MAETGQAAMQKAKTVSETAKLNAQIGELQKNIRALYAQIGEEYVKLHADAPETALAGLVDEVRQANDQIVQCQETIAKLSNTKTCPSCGAVLSDSAAFCSSCGASIPKDIPGKEEASACPKCGGPVEPGAAFQLRRCAESAVGTRLRLLRRGAGPRQQVLHQVRHTGGGGVNCRACSSGRRPGLSPLVL